MQGIGVTTRRTRNDQDEWPDKNGQNAWGGWWLPTDNTCDFKCQLGVYFNTAIHSKIGLNTGTRKTKLGDGVDGVKWDEDTAATEEAKPSGVHHVFDGDHFFAAVEKGGEKHWFHKDAIADPTFRTTPETVYRGFNPYNDYGGWVIPDDVTIHAE